MKILYIFALFIICFSVNAQTNPLQVNANIVLPKDSSASKLLITSLNNFLAAAQQSNEENQFVFAKEKVETFILLDEINGIEKSDKFKDDYFYKPYLTNVVALKDSTYLLQVSYIGNRDSISFLRASFEFIAHKSANSFVFSSPLLRNTEHWKIEKRGNNTFHYQGNINTEKVKEFSKLTVSFDSKLKTMHKMIDYYCCNDIMELEKLIGVAYKSDYNGRRESVWSSSYMDRKLIIFGNNNAGFNEFDPHDLFHDRLGLAIARSKVNKPVDEGCAYLYGGSWGLSWNEIFKAFKKQIASNKNTDWFEIKETPVYFKTKEFDNSADYIVNALLIKEIEAKKGFAGVWELMNVGPFEKGNTKYYQMLEQLTGVTKANYNEHIWSLINNEK